MLVQFVGSPGVSGVGDCRVFFCVWSQTRTLDVTWVKVVCFSAVGPSVRGGQASWLKDCGGRLHANDSFTHEEH